VGGTDGKGGVVAKESKKRKTKLHLEEGGKSFTGGTRKGAWQSSRGQIVGTEKKIRIGSTRQPENSEGNWKAEKPPPNWEKKKNQQD